MKNFAVTIEEVEEVRKHSNADRLEIVKLSGINYQMVVGIDSYEVGDKVVYFPLDSIIPNSILEMMGLDDKLSGKEKNIVKTIKLRGEISQGIICQRSLLALAAIVRDGELVSQHWLLSPLLEVGADVTTILGIEKYEPEPKTSKAGKLHRLPSYFTKYDIENAERHADVLNMMLPLVVHITEKLEGAHWACSLDCDTGEVHVFQRNYEIIPIEGGEHTWWRVFREGDFESKLNTIKKRIEALLTSDGNPINPKYITIRGELIGPGVQKNYYKLLNNEVRVFELEIDGLPMSMNFYSNVISVDLFNDKSELSWVPILYIGLLEDWLEGRSLDFASEGMSVINPDLLREGIVIKPIVTIDLAGFGRVFLKQRSSEYLSKSKL